MTIQHKRRQMLDFGIAVGPQVYRILRSRIISNDLEPGIRVSESEIASEYAISRQPVREAFIKLSEEGLVEIRPQRGTFVRKIDGVSVMDARFVREAVEADIVKQLADSVTPETIAQLRQEISAQQQAENDPVRFMELDERFHALLADFAGKARVWKHLEGLKSQMDRVRHLSMMRFPVTKLIAQHAAIVEAIARRDRNEAEAAIRGHLREILNDLPAIEEANPEFFANQP